MFYAILAYHVEDAIKALTPQEDAALMAELLKINTQLHEAGTLGPSARLGATQDAVTLRGPGDGVVIDGPFAETKELIAGYWMWQVRSMEEAVEWLKRCPNPMPGESEVEIRPVYEMTDFGENFTPEAREKEERLRKNIAAKK